MRKLRTLVALSLFLSTVPVPVRAQSGGILLSAVAGTVELQEGPDQAWAAATAGKEIREGYSIRTGPDGRAQVTFPDKATVWIKENATFGMQSTLPLTRKVQVLQGDIKVDVPHLKRKQTFEVHTANAVAAVRGTRFAVSVLPGGLLNIKVAYGEVKMNLIGDARSFSIPQGNFFNQEQGGEGKVSLMNGQQESEVLEDWSPGVDSDKRMAALDQKQEDRGDIRAFARATDAQQAAVDNLVAQTKDEDFAAGRSLVDVHGNLVRVDQKLLRPDDATIQFLNLVKRPSYTYKDNLGAATPYSYTGGVVTSRLDTMQGKIVFDADLPQDLVEWPAFFDDNDVEIKTADFYFTNQTDSQDILAMGTFADYCGKSYGVTSPCYSEFGAFDGTHDEIAGDFYIGSQLTLDDFGNRSVLLGKMLKAEKAPNSDSFEVDGESSEMLFSHNADAFCAPDCLTGGHRHFWLAAETFAINNSGAILTVDGLVNSGKDPFSVLKETAGQLIFHFKTPNGGAGVDPSGSATTGTGFITDTDANFTFGAVTFDARASAGHPSNIDLVIIPDLVVSMVQRMSTALEGIDSGDGEDN